MNGKVHMDLSPHFWIGLIIFLSTAISSGTVHLTNAIPDSSIPYVVAWSSIISVVGTGYLTVALGLHNADPAIRRELVANQPGTMVVTTNDGVKKLADTLAKIPEVAAVISTPAIAEATTSDKVVAVSPQMT